jgi:hypothetical protein
MAVLNAPWLMSGLKASLDDAQAEIA